MLRFEPRLGVLVLSVPSDQVPLWVLKFLEIAKIRSIKLAKLKIPPGVNIWTFLALNRSFCRLVFEGFWGLGVGCGLWTCKRNSLLYTSLWKEEEVGFESTLS